MVISLSVMKSTRVSLTVLALGLAACSSVGDSEQSPDASTVAQELKAASSTAIEVVTITEDNDPNDLIGRPNGYESAAIVYDSEVPCDEIGSACGVVVEVFADEEAARNRADYIQGILSNAPIFGTEWNYVKGPVLVRITGGLKPSTAEQYAEAFGGDEVTSGG